MLTPQNKVFIAVIFLLLFFSSQTSFGQRTVIRGFVDAYASSQNGKFGFGLGEQDLFITSELNDRISFLGESVFKFSLGSPTSFDVSIERVVLKYNFHGNHNLLLGKHHTPVNYWNYTYHHGRVFFPTIERPLLFEAEIIPLHTTGLSIQGQNLGESKFGYDFMIGNGLGASDLGDNDKRKSITAGVRISPKEGLTLGGTYYNDVIAQGAKMHGGQINNWKVNQNLYSGSVAYFGKKFELLAEASITSNHTDTTGTKETFAGYFYAGYKIKEKFVPYIRMDNINSQSGEVYYHHPDRTSFVAGFRYEINYLSVVKLEFQHSNISMTGKADKVMAQFAIGF
ncbi:MAG: hypothetical protein JWQ40_623 [Segetibacter sp.]|nr:hypothetical protein [Segetibacter sp.]